MLVTQRRPRAELDVTADGADARAVADDRAGVRGPARSRTLERRRRVGGAVTVGVRQPHVPPPVAVGVDVRLIADERPVGEAVPIGVEQPVVGRTVTVEVHLRPADRLARRPARTSASRRLRPFESTLHVPVPSSVKDASGCPSSSRSRTA